jgi:hypothetical protein
MRHDRVTTIATKTTKGKVTLGEIMRIGVKRFGVIVALMLFSVAPFALGQSTVGTGNIQGTVTDPTGAVVPAAAVQITNRDTGQKVKVTTTGSGTYNSGTLQPGNYTVRVQAAGFEAIDTPAVVQVGNITPVNVKLGITKAEQSISVEASSVHIDTDQATVQGVLTSQQIDNLPVNGRNFLDLAQLEPGVQIQDGTNFDPTKIGYSSISFGGRFGRTARISVDGVDVSDETVGTTTEDIPASAIQEFQIAQSSLDLSNDLSTSGTVNVVTRSGTNSYHGEGFELFRSSDVGAHLPAPPGLTAPYQRDQFGGRFGGAIIKDKLFFFLDGERTKSDLQSPVAYSDPFSSFSGRFPAPFHEGEALGKLDYQLAQNVHVFYRMSYFQAKTEGTFFSSSLQPYRNIDFTRQHVVGVDLTTGRFTHSIRFNYLKFQNNIVDADIGSGLPLSNFPGNGQFVNLTLNNGPATGPNLLAPQETPQSDKQFKYDGSRVLGNHIIRYGASINHIQGGGFASFFKLAPEIQSNFASSDSAAAATGPFAGGASNPLNYPVEVVILGNGQGFSTEHPAFGLPAGGLGPDNRLGIYLGDGWKMFPNLTVSLGLRYDRDTGRTDSDLAAIPQLNNLLPNFPNLGAPVPEQNTNVAPQLGVTWDPFKTGKTVIRAGIGLFYENVIYNNVLFDRPLRLASGAFLQTPLACLFGTPQPVPVPSGNIFLPASACTGTIGQEAATIAAFQAQYQALSPFSLSTPNPSFIGTQIAHGVTPGTGMFAPDYRTPRSTQMNIGIQRELHPGMVVTADFVRNVGTQLPLSIDLNHVGDVKNFNLAGANQAIAATNTAFGCAGGATPAATGCAIAAGATMVDYATNGLGTVADTALGSIGSCPAAGCAFGGINPKVAGLPFLIPAGRSVYNGLQAKLVQNVKSPLPELKALNLQVAYSLSRFTNCGGTGTAGVTQGNSDQDFVIGAVDQNNPCEFAGPSLLDRTHQLSFGFIADLPGNFHFSTIGHIYSPLATSINDPNSGMGPGEIFRSDFTGDGTVQDLLPGTKVGSFGRDVTVNGLTNLINNYNANIANQPTPAGELLIKNGLFTLAQLQAIGGVAQPIANAGTSNVPVIPGEVGQDWLKDVDMKFSWTYKVRERVTLEPSVGVYNVFNLSNFDLPPNVLSPLLTGAPGSINGTTQANRVTDRVGAGTGVFGLGSPRAFEFGLRLEF